MSDGESDHATDSDSTSSESDSGYGSVGWDFSDWWQGAWNAEVELCEDDISTVCFESDSDRNSLHAPPNTDDLETIGYSSELEATEDGSSHGTVEEYCANYECQICHGRPTPGEAVVINDTWMLEGVCRMHINGTSFLVCATCHHTFHGDCVDVDNNSIVGDVTEYICMGCQNQ